MTLFAAFGFGVGRFLFVPTIGFSYRNGIPLFKVLLEQLFGYAIFGAPSSGLVLWIVALAIALCALLLTRRHRGYIRGVLFANLLWIGVIVGLVLGVFWTARHGLPNIPL
ncbi:MAG TPA: hypothetical protein VIJ12_03355 [Candidatus Baltobacteraceae bacterium]